MAGESRPANQESAATTMATLSCPQCGDRMSEIEVLNGKCLTCGAFLPFQVGGHVTAAESRERGESIGVVEESARLEESGAASRLNLAGGENLPRRRWRDTGGAGAFAAPAGPKAWPWLAISNRWASGLPWVMAR